MAARQAFTPPDEQDDDVLDFLASGRPAAPAAVPVPRVPQVPAVATPPPRSDVPAAAPPAPRTAPATRARRSVPAPAPAEPVRPVGLKRIGLYVDMPTWAQLKKIGLERAERGQAADFTSIVLEALRAQYPNGRWDKR